MTEVPVAPRVAVKSVPPVDVVFVRARVAVRDIGRLFAAAGRKLHGPAAGAPLVIYHDAIFDPEAADVEVAYPVKADAEETLLPVTAASITHVGPYERLNEAYGLLSAWVADHGLRQSGAVREIYLIGPGDVDDPEHFVTEVQMPVEQRGLSEL